MDKIVEVCCGSYYDALQAQYGGARRIELNRCITLRWLNPIISNFIKS